MARKKSTVAIPDAPILLDPPPVMETPVESKVAERHEPYEMEQEFVAFAEVDGVIRARSGAGWHLVWLLESTRPVRGFENRLERIGGYTFFWERPKLDTEGT